MRAILIVAALVSLSSPAWAGSTLWQNVNAGMTTEQVHALYPEGRDREDRLVEYHDKLTELHGFLSIGKCKPRVEIQHPKGVVTGVLIWMQSRGSLVPTCADEARAAALTKFGEPITRQAKNALPGDPLHGDEETLTWAKDGIAVTYFHENRHDSWRLEYQAGAGKDASGL